MGALLEPFFYIIGFVVDIYFKVVVVEIVLHWLIYFKILEANTSMLRKRWRFWKRQRSRFIRKSARKFRRYPVLTFHRLFYC